MKMISGLGRWFGFGSQRRTPRIVDDPADMGTAFGLDWITPSTAESAHTTQKGDDSMPVPSGFQRRLDRRSSL